MKRKLGDTQMSRRKFLKVFGTVGGSAMLSSFLGYDLFKPQKAWASPS
jgi:hypothetical protein